MSEQGIESIRALLKITRRQLLLSGVFSAAIAVSIVTARLLTSLYQGYGRNVLAEIPGGPLGGNPFLLAIRSISDGITFAWINHSVHYYPYAAIVVVVLFLSPARRLITGIPGRLATASVVLGSLLGFGHFFLFSGNWQEGYWENTRFHAVLFVLTLPSMIYFSHAMLLTLIQRERDVPGANHADERFRSNLVWIFAATALLMMGLRWLQGLSFAVGEDLFSALIYPLTMGGAAVFLLDAYVRWLMEPGRPFLSVDFRFSTMAVVCVAQIAAHATRMILLQGWRPDTRAGQASYWFVYSFVFCMTSMYSAVILANASVRQTEAQSSEESVC